MISAAPVRWRCGRTAVLVAVCAVALSVADRAQAASPDPNLALARAEAAQLVALVPLPPATTPVRIDPFTGGPFAPPGPAGRWQVLAAGHWLAPVTALAARSYLTSHQPPGATQTSVSFGGGTLDWGETLSFRTSEAGLTSATLEISVDPYASSQARIDAVATVLWKPTWEQVPAGTRGLSVSVDRGPPVIVGARRRIAAFARLFAGLPTMAPGAYSCPAAFDPATALVRLRGAGGRTLGTVRVSDYGCDEVQFRFGARRAAPLWDDGLLELLWRERAVRSCRASQLTGTITPAKLVAGGHAIDIKLTNTSRTACSLDGFPRVAFRTADGATLQLGQAHDRTRAPKLVAAAVPRHALVITASWPESRASCPGRSFSSVTLRMPRVSGSLDASGSTAVSVCRGPVRISPVFNPGVESNLY
jgi:Domain of unknown function (DUF4232)